MSNLVQPPYVIFTDANGDPLEDGHIYIGEPGLSPITNPLQAYWDADLTAPATNIRTKNGYPSRSGTPARLYTATNYSILVQDRNNVTIYTNLNSIDYFNSASGVLISSVETIADLRGIVPGEPYVQVSVGGSASIGDGLMGPLYYWDPASSATDNGVSIIQPTAVTGNGRWLWINTIAPTDVVSISASGTLTMTFINRIVLVDTALPITLAIPDGDFNGQELYISNRGVDTLTITGTGIPSGTLVAETTTLKWLVTEWSVSFLGVRAVTGEEILTRVVPIGDWNMYFSSIGDQTLSVLHGVTDKADILSVNILIRNDADNTIRPIDFDVGTGASGSYTIGATTILMTVATSKTFDNTTHSSTGFSRGNVYITYKV